MQLLIINAHPAPHRPEHCANHMVVRLKEKLPHAPVLNIYDEDIPALIDVTIPLISSKTPWMPTWGSRIGL